MFKTQFYSTLIWTVVETQLAIWLLQTGSWLFSVFLAFMVVGNIARARRTEKILKKNGFL